MMLRVAVALAWQKKRVGGMRMPSAAARAVHALKDENCPILISPSLVSLDLPDIWASNPTPHDFSSAHKCCKYFFYPSIWLL